jgi:hypothetical protein
MKAIVKNFNESKTEMKTGQRRQVSLFLLRKRALCACRAKNIHETYRETEYDVTTYGLMGFFLPI